MQGRGRSPHQGEEQIADLKLVCDALFAGGTNQIIWHGFPYNKVGSEIFIEVRGRLLKAQVVKMPFYKK